MASVNNRPATPYNKPKTFKDKQVKIETPVYAENLKNAAATARDISEELKRELDTYAKNAKQRVKVLIDIIQKLRKELQETKEMLVAANRDNLHPSLLQIAEDPSKWYAGDEDKAAS